MAMSFTTATGGRINSGRLPCQKVKVHHGHSAVATTLTAVTAILRSSNFTAGFAELTVMMMMMIMMMMQTAGRIITLMAESTYKTQLLLRWLHIALCIVLND